MLLSNLWKQAVSDMCQFDKQHNGPTWLRCGTLASVVPLLLVSFSCGRREKNRFLGVGVGIALALALAY